MRASAERFGARDGYADLSEVRLHYVEAGTGPLVVMLHGFPDFWYSWRHQIEALAGAGLRVVAVDMRGYNLSDQPEGVSAYSIERLTSDVAELVENLGAERAHVVGHDWGAIVAWFFAMEHPELLDRLGIVNVPHPSRFVEMARSPAQVLRSWYVLFFQLPLLPEAVLAASDFKALRRVFHVEPERDGAFDDEDVDAYVAAAKRANNMRGPINYYRALGRRNPLGRQEDARRRIDNEVLVLWGERDGALERSLADPDPELVPHAKVVRYPESGHWVHVERPQEVNSELIAFLT